jgi:5-methylcytosine-specific restriction endonuclease McrA
MSGYKGKIDKKRLHEIYERNGKRCFYCLSPLEVKHITIDHFKPRSEYRHGTNNRVISCGKCNSMKQSLSLYQFRERMTLEAARFMRRPSIRKLPNKEIIFRLEYYKKLLPNLTKLLKSENLQSHLF